MSQATPSGAVSIPLPKGVRRELLAHCENYTVTRMHVEKDVQSPPHQHPHEQVVYMLSGQGAFNMGNESFQLKAGECISIPSNIPHSFAKLDEDILFLEFFVPGREDINQASR